MITDRKKSYRGRGSQAPIKICCLPGKRRAAQLGLVWLDPVLPIGELQRFYQSRPYPSQPFRHHWICPKAPDASKYPSLLDRRAGDRRDNLKSRGWTLTSLFQQLSIPNGFLFQASFYDQHFSFCDPLVQRFSLKWASTTPLRGRLYNNVFND